MPDYLVTWEIDVTAETPVEAAREALRIQRNPESIATVFGVADGFDVRRVDLTELDDDPDGDLCRDCAQPYEDGGDGYNGRCPDCADAAEAEGRSDD